MKFHSLITLFRNRNMLIPLTSFITSYSFCEKRRNFNLQWNWFKWFSHPTLCRIRWMVFQAGHFLTAVVVSAMWLVVTQPAFWIWPWCNHMHPSNIESTKSYNNCYNWLLSTQLNVELWTIVNTNTSKATINPDSQVQTVFLLIFYTQLEI